jgi:hypothetical protein
MEGSTEEGIRATLGVVRWEDLRVHVERDGLILVDPPLEVLEVALALAEDRADIVGRWLEEGRVHKPDAATLAAVEASPDVSFQMVICQPWVVAQMLAN